MQAKARKNPSDCTKSVDPTTLSPCSKVLLQQIKRACYAAHLYSTAYNAYPAFNYFLLTMVKWKWGILGDALVWWESNPWEHWKAWNW